MDRYFIRDLRTYVFKMNWRNYFWSFCIDNMWRLFKSQKGGQNEILNPLVVLFKRIYFCRFEWHFQTLEEAAGHFFLLKLPLCFLRKFVPIPEPKWHFQTMMIHAHSIQNMFLSLLSASHSDAKSEKKCKNFVKSLFQIFFFAICPRRTDWPKG